MKNRRAFLFLLALICLTFFMVWFVCNQVIPAPESVLIMNPCNTFVSEGAPMNTPAFKPAKSGFELTISFTPAKDPEADAVFTAVESGTKKLLVAYDRYEIHALRIENNYLVLYAASKSHAKEILERLCFK